MTPALWLVAGIVIVFCIYTVCVFLTPPSKDQDK